jgi:hypothetical protein
LDEETDTVIMIDRLKAYPDINEPKICHYTLDL